MTSMRKLRRRERRFERYFHRYWPSLGLKGWTGGALSRAIRATNREVRRRNPSTCFDCGQTEPCPCPDLGSPS